MRAIGILLEDYFDEREVVYPYYRVQEAGFQPLMIGPKPGLYHGKTPSPLRLPLPPARSKPGIWRA